MEIRVLRADEIECRVGSVKKSRNGSVGCSLLLYKDARCDMNILDEVFGPLGWERTHTSINNNLFCTVSVYDEEHNRWISKQDVGTESNADKEKGQASDSFKRACFNIGIGRELYTAPFIWVTLEDNEVRALGNDKYACYTKFVVKSVSYENRKIVSLVIEDEKGKVRYALNAPETVVSGASNKGVESQDKTQNTSKKQSSESDGKARKRLTDKQVKRLLAIAASKGYSEENVMKSAKAWYSVTDLHDLDKADYEDMCNGYEKAAARN